MVPLHFLLCHHIKQYNQMGIVKRWIATKAATRAILWKKVFLEISQNLREITCARVTFLIKMQAWGPQNDHFRTMVAILLRSFAQFDLFRFSLITLYVALYFFWRKLASSSTTDEMIFTLFLFRVLSHSGFSPLIKLLPE